MPALRNSSLPKFVCTLLMTEKKKSLTIGRADSLGCLLSKGCVSSQHVELTGTDSLSLVTPCRPLKLMEVLLDCKACKPLRLHFIQALVLPSRSRMQQLSTKQHTSS